MDMVMVMVMGGNLLVLLLLLLVIKGEGLSDCQETKCGKHEPSIRFPFRLKHQPADCGYPGFDLDCSDSGKTVLTLPTSVQLYISSIDYVSQVMYTYDPENCLPRQAATSNLSLLASPFGYAAPYLRNFALFNCTSVARVSYTTVPCLDVPGYQFYYFDTLILLSNLPLGSCTKTVNISSVPEEIFELYHNKYLRLNWTKPECGMCEARKKHCRFSSNGRGAGTECFDPPKDMKAFRKKLLIAGICVGLFLLVVVIGVLYYLYSSDKKEKENEARIEKFLEDYRALRPTRYLYSDLERITDKFKDKLGHGAYGTVYKGRLSKEVYVAVKILDTSTSNGEEFVNEVGTMGTIHHVNVVRLVGFCADGFRRALVYEYLPNDSLEKFIFSADGPKHSLGWEKLQDIALGVARGIEYLHRGCDQMILHFDIKPQNVLLDEKFAPKISDFGLAKLCAKDQSAVPMTAARGTMGYIAPEMFSRNFGNVSYKSDVYSFGMLLLELVGGRKNIDANAERTSQIYFPKWVYKHLDQGQELGVQVEAEADTKIARQLIVVGLWCIQWFPLNRPSMNIVVQMLEGEGDKLPVPPDPFASKGPNAADVAADAREFQSLLPTIFETD